MGHVIPRANSQPAAPPLVSAPTSLPSTFKRSVSLFKNVRRTKSGSAIKLSRFENGGAAYGKRAGTFPVTAQIKIRSKI